LFSGAFAYFIESTLILNGCLFFSSNCYIISKSAGSIAITLFALWMVDRSASLFSGAFAFYRINFDSEWVPVFSSNCYIISKSAGSYSEFNWKEWIIYGTSDMP
jgi:hypothetical protein